MELDYRCILYDTSSERIVFPTRPAKELQNPEEEYRRFNMFLSEQGLSFVKPVKTPYTEVEHGQLLTVFDQYVKENLAALPCVDRVYLLNAASNKRTGRYEVPFVHFDWAKLGSDFDLLIEIDEEYPLPPEWEFKFHWHVCSSDYYHLGDVNFPIPSEYVNRYPYVPFRGHLVEAYLFFPSKGKVAVKDVYLKKFNAAALYRKGSKTPRSLHDEPLYRVLADEYGIDEVALEKIEVPSFNQVIRVRATSGNFALKVMKREDFTPAVKGKSGKHLEYEEVLLAALSGRDLPVVAPLPAASGRTLIPLSDGRFCMLFPFIDSTAIEGDACIVRAATALARLHKGIAEVDAPTNLYRFHEAAAYWLDQYRELFPRFSTDSDQHRRFEALLAPAAHTRDALLDNSALAWLHSHGDMSPRNFFYVGERTLIFDFQAAHFGPLIEDLAEGALEFAWSGDELRQQATETFIAAYHAIHPLRTADHDALPAMLLLQAVIKLARSFRIEVVFGYKVNRHRIKAFLEYAERASARLG